MGMHRAGVSLEAIKTKLMSDPDFAVEYKRLKPRYDLIAQIIKIREKQHISQAELAKRMGTQKSNISRLERGNYNPSLDFLIKTARSLGKEIKVTIK
jgi:DNA-binding XRE family transcriptional regulator